MGGGYASYSPRPMWSHVIFTADVSCLLSVCKHNVHIVEVSVEENEQLTRMWANAQRDGRPVEHRWRPLFNAAKFS